MLSLLGRDAAIRNIYLLAALVRPAEELDTTERLRSAYLDFLDTHQRGVLANRSDDVFRIQEKIEAQFSGAFQNGALNDLHQAEVVGELYDAENYQRRTTFATQALQELLKLDDDLALIFSLAIHAVFIRASHRKPGFPGSHGGSSSASIGAIWLTVDNQLGKIDIQEMMVHELAHHLLFIDELNHPQFNYKSIAIQENFALSAILKRQRPLDKVIHSIVVGTEILLARKSYLPSTNRTIIHPNNSELSKNTIEAIHSVFDLKNIHQLVTPHLLGIVELCENVCKRQLQ